MKDIVVMLEEHLAGVDLNLLTVLHALLEERGVTRAAARLGRTQPAVSRSLARLRRLLGDPLFVRDGAMLRPTPRALALQEPVRRVLLDVVGQVLAPEVFDPATARRTFNVSVADYAGTVLLPELIGEVTRSAPGVTLLLGGGRQPLRDVAEEADLGIGPIPASFTSASLKKRVIAHDTFVCLLRRDHPRVGDALDLDTFVALDHLLVSPRGTPGGVVDDQLAARGLHRRVTVRVGSFLMAPNVIAASDLVTTLPRSLAVRAARDLPLRLLEPPLPIPGFDVHLVWHERWQHDPGHTWLRERIAAAASRATAGSATLAVLEDR